MNIVRWNPMRDMELFSNRMTSFFGAEKDKTPDEREQDRLDRLDKEREPRGGEDDLYRPDETFYQGVHATFDPQKSLVVAVICDPPCLTGIQAKFTAYKEILRLYNVCYNTAIIRGDGTHACDKFYSSQVCQQIVMEFWHYIYDLIRQFVVKSLVYWTEKYIMDDLLCEKLLKTSGTSEPCLIYKIKEALGVAFVIMETADVIDQLMSGELYKSRKDKEKDANDRERLVKELDKGK